MSEIRITRDYPYSGRTVWRAVTDPAIVPRWTSTGRGGRPEGFSTEVGSHFRFVGKRVPGWRGIVECKVLEATPPSLLRYSWRGDDHGEVTQVTYRLEPQAGGTRFSYEHTGFTGIGGFFMAKVVLGPVRTKMLDVGLPGVLATMDEDDPPPVCRPKGDLSS